jgi:hypothetical protein
MVMWCCELYIYYILAIFYAIQTSHEFRRTAGWFLVQFTGKFFKFQVGRSIGRRRGAQGGIGGNVKTYGKSCIAEGKEGGGRGGAQGKSHKRSGKD